MWGEDMILNSSELIDHSQAVALTYCETYTLRRNELEDCLEDFPLARKTVRKAARRITLQRILLQEMARRAGRDVRSFASRSAARGFSEVDDTMTLEQKVDVILQDHLREKRKAWLGEENQIAMGAEPSTSHRAMIEPSTMSPAKLRNAEAEFGAPAPSPTVAGSGTSGAAHEALSARVDALGAKQAAGFERLASQQQAMAAKLDSLLEALKSSRGGAGS